MLKREWCAESNWKLPHLFIPTKTAASVPEFAVEDLPLGRTAVLVAGFTVKDLPLGRTLTTIPLLTTLGNHTRCTDRSLRFGPADKQGYKDFIRLSLRPTQTRVFRLSSFVHLAM